MDLGKGMFLKHFREKIAVLFKDIREELDDHCSSINENTSEIQANYGLLIEVSEKLDKLSSRLDKMEFSLVKGRAFSSIQPLNEPERKVFLSLYTTQAPLTYDDLARKSGISPLMVGSLVSSLIEKGVPLIKSYVSGQPFVKLNPDFKELQAKANILNISLESYFEKEEDFNQ